MSVSVIDKYVAKKEKDLLEYAKILESIITIDENKMWQNKSTFSKYASAIIAIYADNYYFVNNANRDNPIEYSNDNINSVLNAIITYLKESEQTEALKIWKNEIFLLSVIICTSCYVDFATNAVDGNLKDTKSKFKYLLKYLSKTKLLHIKENKYWLKDLFDAVKKNTTNDKKMFESIISDNCYNEYCNVCQNYYDVIFKYKIEGIDVYNSNLVDKVLKEYDVKFKDMSFEILVFHLLEELISNKEMNIYLIKADSALKKMPNKYWDNKYIKDYVSLLVPFNEKDNYQKIIDDYSKKEIKIIYDYSGVEKVDIKIFESNTNILVSNLFMENNKDLKTLADELNIHFMVRNKED